MWVLPLLMTGVAHAEPVATVSAALPAVHAAVAFKVIPAGSRDEATMMKVLHEKAATLGDVPAHLGDVNRWSDRLTDTLRQGGFPVGQVLMTEDDWRAAQKGATPIFTVYPGRIRKIVVKNKSRVDDARLQRLITHALCRGDQASDVCVLSMPRLDRQSPAVFAGPGRGRYRSDLQHCCKGQADAGRPHHG